MISTDNRRRSASVHESVRFLGARLFIVIAVALVCPNQESGPVGVGFRSFCNGIVRNVPPEGDTIRQAGAIRCWRRQMRKNGVSHIQTLSSYRIQ